MQVNEKQMLAMAQSLANAIDEFLNKKKSIIIFLKGNLGAGKTTFVRAFLQTFDANIRVKSPTYTLVEPYSIFVKEADNDRINNQLSVYHFDLYRLVDPFELFDIGIEEYLSQGVSFIEWPDKGEGVLPEPDIEISIEHAGSQRQIMVSSGNNDFDGQLKAIYNR